MSEGTFYYFLRLPGPVRAGHIGWGCSLEDGRWMYGALENAGGNPNVSAGGYWATFWGFPEGDNDYWSAFASSEAEMISQMSLMTEARRITGRETLKPYTCYKKVPVRDSRSKDAIKLGMWWSGYSLTSNNCLDNTTKVAKAYGVDASLHPGFIQVRPRGFFFNRLHAYPTIPLGAEPIEQGESFDGMAMGA